MKKLSAVLFSAMVVFANVSHAGQCGGWRTTSVQSLPNITSTGFGVMNNSFSMNGQLLAVDFSTFQVAGISNYTQYIKSKSPGAVVTCPSAARYVMTHINSIYPDQRITLSINPSQFRCTVQDRVQNYNDTDRINGLLFQNVGFWGTVNVIANNGIVGRPATFRFETRTCH